MLGGVSNMSNLLWQPSEEQIQSSNMHRFMTLVNQQYGTSLDNYDDLYQWSIDNIPEFWKQMWDFGSIIASAPYEKIIDDVSKMPGAEWFEGCRLNFAENLLRYRDDNLALVFRGEDTIRRTFTYAQLYDEVARVAQALKDTGIKEGDRVVGFVPNMPESVIAMLATTSLGAVWSSCSPDFGIKGVLDRFGQIQPKVLFTADGYFFKGRALDCLARITEIVQQIPSIDKLVVVPYTQKQPDISTISTAILYDDFKSPDESLEIEFVQVPSNHPLYIMYSSGTTGQPKCLVQSTGGILLHHLKELMLHSDVSRDDTIFYFTTCGWMMWNWLVSSLATGATLVLYDGNPFHPSPGTLWKMAQDEKITVFGTSAGYLSALQNSGVRPKEKYDLSPLRAVLSTGGPLTIESFNFVYDAIKSDLQLASIAGGTDLNGCFALGNPMGPVYAGELQCRGLAMKVFAYDDDGRPVVGQEGELVCTAPFPSMPIYFWNDADGKKYHGAYFDVFPNVWRHGDYIVITEHGGVVIHGRSDATLNPGGVRIGTAEVYRRVEQLEEILDSVVVGQNWKNDVRVILFVKMNPSFKLSDKLKDKIRKTIREHASPRHVPAKIVSVPDIPYTLNMKKVELAVKKVIHNQEVKNKDALKNPDCLDYFMGISEIQEE
jgi:acetoacetyl-CoA synthetase